MAASGLHLSSSGLDVVLDTRRAGSRRHLQATAARPLADVAGVVDGEPGTVELPLPSSGAPASPWASPSKEPPAWGRSPARPPTASAPNLRVLLQKLPPSIRNGLRMADGPTALHELVTATELLCGCETPPKATDGAAPCTAEDRMNGRAQTGDAPRSELPSECAACLMPLERRQILRRISACAHTFHAACLEQWLSRSRRCPACRGDIARELEVGALEERGDDSPHGKFPPVCALDGRRPAAASVAAPCQGDECGGAAAPVASVPGGAEALGGRRQADERATRRADGDAAAYPAGRLPQRHWGREAMGNAVKRIGGQHSRDVDDYTQGENYHGAAAQQADHEDNGADKLYSTNGTARGVVHLSLTDSGRFEPLLSAQQVDPRRLRTAGDAQRPQPSGRSME
eukprot:GHVT01095410.1.p1 GENE.GHVT01095410.1~~GHVT01095410.1.p1  ORF type:complete len:402 (-),score=82.67 GHVT01095410.1:1185-2390(-)